MNKAALNEISEAVLIEAMEANMFGQMAYYASYLPQMNILDENGFLLIDSGIPSDTFNYICRARLTERNIDAIIDKAIDYFKSRGLPFAWWVGPGSRPSNLGTYLEKHGLKCTEYDEGMAADLWELPVNYPMPKGLKINKIATIDELKLFANVLASVFNPPDPWVNFFYKQTANLVFKKNSPIHLYLGYLNDEPVATCVLFLEAGVAGIYSVATIKQARKQGIGTALTLAALHDARDHGYQIGTLQASLDGQNLYARIGFKAYCKFYTYQ